MKYLVIIFLIILSHGLFANDDKLIVKNGIEKVEIDSETELLDLSWEYDLTKEAVKALDYANFPLALDDRFSTTPFLYFFNGLMPKDSTDKRIWSIGGITFIS